LPVADYTTVDAVKASLDINDDTENSLIQVAITAASRAIDLATGTTFGTAQNDPEPRMFFPDGASRVWVDRFTDTTGLAVATGNNGSFGSPLAAANYVLWPYNAPSRGQAYERIDVPYALLQPASCNGFPTVQVTARWGYDSVPAAVEMATRIKAMHLFRRKDSPDGYAGAEYGTPIRISMYEDNDVVLLLEDYLTAGIA
jgi:hypothetical protein